MDKKLINFGEIYLISYGDKKYIGQCYLYKKSGKKFKKGGTLNRWKCHIYGATKNTKYSGCTYLYRAIRKYGHENFTVKTLFKCEKRDLDFFEMFMIKLHNTLAPHGFNLTTGGKKNICFSNISIKKMSTSKKGNKNPNFGKKMSTQQKNEISKTKLFVRKKNYDLPIYIYHYRNKHKEGYVIKNHPQIKYKSFLSMKKNMEEKLSDAKEYIKNL